MTKILALDVSLSRTGVAVLDDGEFVAHGVIATKASAPRHARLGQLASGVALFVSQYRPDIIAIETSALWQRMSHDSRDSIEALAQARGACLVAADWTTVTDHLSTRIVELSPNYVRSIVCANPGASKEQVVENLRLRGYALPLLKNGKVDLDVSDSLALGVCVWCELRLFAMQPVAP